MIDGSDVLAAVARGEWPHSGQVIRVRWYRFVAFLVVGLLALALALYSTISAGTSTLSSLPNSHASTLLFVSACLFLAALLLLSTLVFTTWRFLRMRRTRLVLLPEGFVYGFVRRWTRHATKSSQVLACASYRDVVDLRLRVVGRIPLSLFSHLELVYIDQDGVESTWRIEEVLALSAPEIARQILTAWASIGVASGAPPRDLGPSSVTSPMPAHAVVAWAWANRGGPDWRVQVPQAPTLFWWRVLSTGIPLIGFGVSCVCSTAFLLPVFILSLVGTSNATPYVQLFLGGALMAEGVLMFAIVRFRVLPLVRRQRLIHQVLILTPWALVLADRLSAHVVHEQPFAELQDLRLRRWLGSFTLVMRAKTGRTWVLALYDDQFKEAGATALAREIIVYAARFSALHAVLPS